MYLYKLIEQLSVSEQAVNLLKALWMNFVCDMFILVYMIRLITHL